MAIRRHEGSKTNHQQGTAGWFRNRAKARHPAPFSTSFSRQQRFLPARLAHMRQTQATTGRGKETPRTGAAANPAQWHRRPALPIGNLHPSDPSLFRTVARADESCCRLPVHTGSLSMREGSAARTDSGSQLEEIPRAKAACCRSIRQRDLHIENRAADTCFASDIVPAVQVGLCLTGSVSGLGHASTLQVACVEDVPRLRGMH